MLLITKLIFLCEDHKSRKLLKSLWNPTSSSHNMIFDNLIVHVDWHLVHIWIISGVISSITYFKQRGFLSQFLSNELLDVLLVALSRVYLTFLLILILVYGNLILICLCLVVVIIVDLSSHFRSFVYWFIFTLNN